MFLKCLILLFFSSCIDGQLYPSQSRSQLCPWPHLDHGRVRVRQRTKLVKFMCSVRYELVGNRYATCRNGEWDVPMPVCVKPGCEHFSVENAVQIRAHHDAWVVTFCMPGYKLVGSSAIYCNGYKWNATSPRCINSSIETSLRCDFENPDICGWTQDELHDFDWKRLNKKTPSSFLSTGPSYDHTFGRGGAGYYMYIESTSKMENESARLLSPIFDSHLAVDGCFSFFYHMFGLGTGGLKVYQKPDRVSMYELLNMTEDKKQYLLFEQWGNLGDLWYSAAPPLKDFHDNFQIVIEGIRGSSFTSDIAIDDVALLKGINCTYFRNAATSPAPTYSESCAGRCFIDGDSDGVYGCQCTQSCFANDRCCPDFMDLCVFNVFSNDTSSTDSGDDASPSDEQPQTEKLVGESTTTVTTSTTPKSLSTPPRPIPESPRPIPKSPRPISKTPRPSVAYITTPKITPTNARPTPKITDQTTRVTTRTTSVKTIPTTMPTTKKVETTTKKVVATTKKVEATTKKVEATTKKLATPKVTTKKVLPTTLKIYNVPTTTTNIDLRVEEKKVEKELNVQKMVAEKPVEHNLSKASSSWKTAIITIVVLSVFAALIYLGVAARTARGREALARIRGRVLATNDSEVRYLNSNDDDL